MLSTVTRERAWLHKAAVLITQTFTHFSLSDGTADVIQRCLLQDGFVTLPHLLFLIESTPSSLFMQLSLKNESMSLKKFT